MRWPFKKSAPSQPAEIEEAIAAPDPVPPKAPPRFELPAPAQEDGAGASAFELRKPTAEELSASIISAQDFRDLERLLSGEPMRPMVVRSVKPPLLNVPVTAPLLSPELVAPAPLPPQPAAENAPRPALPVANKVPAAVQNELAAVNAAPAAAAGARPQLVGLCDLIKIGEFVGGWAGDRSGVESDSVRAVLFVDGKAVGSAKPEHKREDTNFLGFRIPFPDLVLSRLVIEGRIRVDIVSTTAAPVTLTIIAEAEPYARYCYKRDFGDPDQLIKVRGPVVVKSEQDLTYVRVPIGVAAADGSAVTGGDGFLFLDQGSNGLTSQYRLPVDDPTVQKDAARWLMLFQQRQAALQQRNVGYAQIVIPEKSTILTSVAPKELTPITARLALLEQMIALEFERSAGKMPVFYRSLVEMLRASYAAGVPPYLRTDSHFRAAGAQLTFYQIIRHLDSLMPQHADGFEAIAALCGHMTPSPETYVLKGDLGERFFGRPLYESDNYGDLAAIEALTPGAPVIAEFPPEGLQNIRLVWRNPNAPSPLKVVAFGNSFFERGGGVHGLSWWFKHMFAEFHFHWRAEMDIAYVNEHKPDIVICQTVERFLPEIPKS
jgi:hypothetical protein